MVNAKALDLRQVFEEEYIKKAEDVFCALDLLGKEWTAGNEAYNRAYCDRVVRLVGEFREMLQKHVLFDCPAGYWGYSIVLRGGGIYLYLNHYRESDLSQMKESVFFTKDESYELACLKTKLLTVEEYAALHKVEHVTAVTRIRRGKIRSAVKVGSQWRIPELAQPVQRGYQSTEYTWRGRLTELPDKYKIIEDYNRAEFFQDDNDLTQFHVRFSGDNIEPMEFTCAREQRGKMEQIFIAHPDVTCLSDVISSIETRCFAGEQR